MIIKAGLLIDFGNSETRVIVLAGAEAYRFNMPNTFTALPAHYVVNNKYRDGRSTIFAHKGTYYANGNIVDYEFSDQALRPSALQAKTEQLTTNLTINLAIIKAYGLLAKRNNVPLETLDIEFKISALLPPLDHETCESDLIDMFKEVTSVDALIHNGGVERLLKKVVLSDEPEIYSEAVAAFFGTLYEETNVRLFEENNGKSLDNGDFIVLDNSPSVALSEVGANNSYFEGYVLVLDIGAGTTDVALFKDTQLIEASRDTFQEGGNTVKSHLLVEIRKKFRFAPPPTMQEDIIRTGYLKEGGMEHRVTDLIDKAKDNYSRKMVTHIRQYLERLSVAMPIVKGLLVAGGGGLSLKDVNGNEISPAMSEVMIRYLRELAPNIESVGTDKNLRDLNIIGLMYLHKNS